MVTYKILGCLGFVEKSARQKYLHSLSRVPLRPCVLHVHVEVSAPVDEPHFGPHLVREVGLERAQVHRLLIDLVGNQVHPEPAAVEGLSSKRREPRLAAQG